MPTLSSIQIGRTQTHGRDDAEDPLQKTWTSAIVKDPVRGVVMLTSGGLVGDEQHSSSHGGPDRALLAYSADHYLLWHEELGQKLPYGGFGENFTIAGLMEDTVCLGDVYQIGDVVKVQVSQPRQPCHNISRRWGLADLMARVKTTGRTGWYMRVLREGVVRAEMPVRRLERPHPQWTISRCHAVMDKRREDPAAAAELAGLAELSVNWREKLASVQPAT